jgi:hypothetical protein
MERTLHRHWRDRGWCRAVPALWIRLFLAGSFLSCSIQLQKLGWDFWAIIETGRFKDYIEMDLPRSTFNLQLSNCLMKSFQAQTTE